MIRCIRVLSLLLALVAAPALPACQDIPPLPKSYASQRAMWVTRFDYKTREDVLKIVEACELAGVNTILFQVRGNATALYRSTYEPWAEQFGFTDPGFDPLSVALDAAHRKGMRLYAWVNVIPAWWGTDPPTDPHQVYNKHPEWMWYDQNGERQKLTDKFYVSLNPCLPEVRKYLVTVMRDLIARYPVDGLHLDYLRFPNEAPAIPAGSKIDYPRDAATVALFRGETELTPDQDRQAWDAWRTEQITNLLRDVRYMVRQTKPSLTLSAAVAADPDQAKTHFQDVRTWMNDDLVDIVYPMNYTRDMKAFQERVTTWKALAGHRPVVMGVRVDSGDVALYRQQLEAARKSFNGFAIFAYSSLFDSPNDEIDQQTEAAREARQERRKAILPMLREFVH